MQGDQLKKLGDCIPTESNLADAKVVNDFLKEMSFHHQLIFAKKSKNRNNFS